MDVCFTLFAYVQVYVCKCLYGCLCIMWMILVCGCIYASTYIYICVFYEKNIYVCVYVCVDICVYVFKIESMWMFLFVCFTNYNLIIVCCQLCIKGKRYKYFTSASTFFQSGCDTINDVNYAFLKVFCLLQVQFQHHLIYCQLC